MTRTKKNIIVSIIIFISVLALGTTIYFAHKSITNTTSNNTQLSQGGMQEPPNGDMGEPPEMPNGEMGEPPEMTEGEEPPAKPDGETNEVTDTKKKSKSSTEDNTSTKKSSKQKSNNQMGERPEKPSGEMGQPQQGNTSSNKTSLSPVYYVAYTLEGIILSSSVMYLILSKANKKTFKETFKDADKIVICILATIIITTATTFGAIQLSKINTTPNTSNNNQMNQNTSISYNASNEITEDKTIKNETYESTESDENSLSVSGNINVTLDNVTVNKTGDSDGGDNTSFYGTNSAIIAKDGANLTIKNATITTDASGANGVFSYGGSATTNNSNSSSDGTTITISDSKITTTQNNSGGIMTTGGGTTIAKNLIVETSGISSAAIRSDRGGGTVSVTGGTYTSHGQGSPAIYSTADINVEDAKLISTASEGVVIEGQNTITLKNVDLTDTNNKINGKSTTYKNIFLYRSMSGDAKDGTSIFTASDSKITTNQGDTFFITNTSTIINLTNNKIINNDSTGGFLRAQAGSWGTEGSNGGQVTLNMTNQKAEGDIYIDSISILSMNMTSSTYVGAINSSNEAQKISIKLDKSSKIKLTGDSYITSLDDEDTSYSNIDLNGYKLYVNGQLIK